MPPRDHDTDDVVVELHPVDAAHHILLDRVHDVVWFPASAGPSLTTFNGLPVPVELVEHICIHGRVHRVHGHETKQLTK